MRYIMRSLENRKESTLRLVHEENGDFNIETFGTTISGKS